MPKDTSQNNLSFRWLVGVLGAVLLSVFTLWISSVQASINKLEDSSSVTLSLQAQIDLMQKQLERIEVKVDKLK